MKRIAWLPLTLLMVVALVLSSCQTATVEEEKETETVAGKVIEKGAAAVEEEEEEEEEVVGEAGPEMVRDPSTGKMVEKPRYGGTIIYRDDNDPQEGLFDPWEAGKGMTAGSIYGILHGGDWGIDRSVQDYKTNYPPVEHGTGYSMTHFENPDPLTYIIYLREGMRFQNKPPVNGREVVADDVKYSFDRHLGLGDFAEQGPSAEVTMHAWAVLESVEVVDKYTLVFHLSSANPILPLYFGCEYHPWIIPREVVDTYGTGYTWEQAVGHGPWQPEDFVTDSSLTLAKHPNYYGRDPKFPENQIPYADKLKILVIPDWSTTLAALRTGKLNRLGVGYEDAAALWESNPELNNCIMYGSCTTLNWNMRKDGPWQDLRVRKALQMAMNVEEYNDTFLGGKSLTYPFMVQGSPGFDRWHTVYEDLPPDCQEGFTYNPERARELLTEAGYPNGFKITVPLTAVTATSDLQISYYEAVGIEVERNVMDGATYGAVVWGPIETREYDVGWEWSCGNWAPLEISGYFYKDVSWNVSNVNDPVFNQMQDDARAETDPVEFDRRLKELFLYGSCQFWYVARPIDAWWNFWQPWHKGYNGENRLTGWQDGAIAARVWIDQDLKYEMIGTRD